MFYLFFLSITLKYRQKQYISLSEVHFDILGNSTTNESQLL